MGTIRLGGLDLRQLHPAEVRAAVGYASQQPAFFDDSLAANFRYAHPSATDADIIEALAAVGLSLPHPALPHGLATRIASTGAGCLSQDLLCRLSIARALVKKPAILLLDDPGDGLDRAGDAAFIAHLSALRGKTTVLLVTAAAEPHAGCRSRHLDARRHGGRGQQPDRSSRTILKQINSTTA